MKQSIPDLITMPLKQVGGQQLGSAPVGQVACGPPPQLLSLRFGAAEAQGQFSDGRRSVAREQPVMLVIPRRRKPLCGHRRNSFAPTRRISWPAVAIPAIEKGVAVKLLPGLPEVVYQTVRGHNLSWSAQIEGGQLGQLLVGRFGAAGF